PTAFFVATGNHAALVTTAGAYVFLFFAGISLKFASMYSVAGVSLCRFRIVRQDKVKYNRCKEFAGKNTHSERQSTMRYVNCCKNKEISMEETKKPLKVQIMENMRKSLEKCCLHPDTAKCKGKIKKAHALQNNKIISLLAGSDRPIYMLDTKRQPLIIPIENGVVETIVEVCKTSANNATVETCFCDYHDSVAFSLIESGAPNFDSTCEKNEVCICLQGIYFLNIINS
ncbi:MAG: hypothetical protein FWB91_05960, partial [Defluviitaleaceae bacterium]|nr:hypothetical protein [Defluviitaleaceae bacterium]